MSDGPILLINAALSDAAELRVRDVLPSLTVVTSAELRDRPAWLAEAEILFTHHVEPSSLGQAPKLRWIQTFGAGVEWLLTPELRARRDLVVTNARGIHAQPIAEHVFGFILMFARRLHHSVVAQTEARWDSGLREGLGTLAGSTLGILGFGSIGRKIAELAARSACESSRSDATRSPNAGSSASSGRTNLRRFSANRTTWSTRFP